MEKVSLKNPSNPKERNLLKAAIRRVFSRSELRKEVIEKSRVTFVPQRSRDLKPRTTKWSICQECATYTPTYLMEVDHISPIIKIDEKLEDLTWDELVDRVWCNLNNLVAKCKPCHKLKTKAENAERRRLKKERLNNEK